MYKKIAIVAVIVLTTMSFVTIEKTIYKAVVSESTAEWTGYKATGQHNGIIGIKNGSIIIVDDKIVGGEFTIDMSSIAVLDTQNKKLLKHLKSDDFFGIKEFPTATFVISGSSSEGDKTLLKGGITIKGVTEKIQILVRISKNEKDQLVLESETFKVNRTKFNITYKSKTFFNNLKDKFIKDEFDMKVKVILSEIEK